MSVLMQLAGCKTWLHWKLFKSDIFLSHTMFHKVRLHSLPSFLFRPNVSFSIVSFSLFLYIFSARLRLMLPVAKTILAQVKTKWSAIKFAPVWNWKMTCLRQNDSQICCGNHFILPNITNLWNDPILLSLTDSHTRGANPTMVINPLDGCQLCFPLRWNMPAPFKSITLLPPSCWALIYELNLEPGIMATFDLPPPTLQDDLVFH